MRRWLNQVTTWGVSGLAMVLAGCGEHPAPPVAAVSTSSTAATSTAETAPVRAATTPPSARPETTDSPAAEPEIPFAEEGTPEWRLYEIARLVVPPPTRKEIIGEDGSSQVVDRSPQEIALERKENLRRVIAHAGQVIAATHADPAQESLLTNAVHYLSAAHVELALMGDAEHARQLGEVSEALYAARPKSAAAVSSAAHLVELARQMADRYGRLDASWARAHATQARIFAERFPQEQTRAAAILLEAGRTCEAAGLPDVARDCYLLLSGRFADTPHADAVAAVLRRMNLPGTTLSAADLSGPTIEGGYLSIEQFRGRYVLVCFWASDSASFEQDVPRLQQLQAEQGDRLVLLGINLDIHEAAVDQFLEAHPLRWQQVFDSDPARRGRQNPVASYYGVSTVPLYWLIDPEGKVLAAPADLNRLPLSPPSSP